MKSEYSAPELEKFGSIQEITEGASYGGDPCPDDKGDKYGDDKFHF